jgi:hypothetical protein
LTSTFRSRATLDIGVGITLGVFLAACSGGSGTVRTDTRVSASGIEVMVPAGWSYGETRDGDLVVASSSSDIEASVPSGPRLVASPADAELPDPAELFATSREEQASIRGEPQQVTVDGQPTVAIETGAVRDGVPIVSRVIAVGGDAGSGYTLTQEAPEAQWDSSRAQLDEVLASVRFVGEGGGGATVAFLAILMALGGATVTVVLLRRRGRAVVPALSHEGIPADWYPDPSGEARLRYWDGTTWTDDTAE